MCPFTFKKGDGEMSLKNMIDHLPEPSNHEEMLIYNFLVGKEVYPVASPAKTKDIYLKALLTKLAMSEQPANRKQPAKKSASKE